MFPNQLTLKIPKRQADSKKIIAIKKYMDDNSEIMEDSDIIANIVMTHFG